MPLPKPEPVPAQDNDVRPEGGSYTANIAAANTMFVTRLHERQGKMQYTDVTTGEQKETSMWMRHEGGHNRWRDGSGQLKTQGNRYVLQMGETSRSGGRVPPTAGIWALWPATVTTTTERPLCAPDTVQKAV